MRQSLERPKPFGRDLGDYEIAAHADDENLAETIHDVAAAMLRADGLRAIARPKRLLTISDRIIRRAHDAELEVVPRAMVSTQFGGKRAVTAKVTGSRAVFLQAVSGEGNTGYDKVRSLFGDATVDHDKLVAVVAHDTTVEPWQRRALNREGVVVDEAELSEFMRELRPAA